ncbi:DUF1788 domain-containing protein [Lentibacter sp. XHP0401]|uniref:DUF1788 domain-containing protein n=1 Tax=Lentibacter sp. XHP0401 TaxID=2984334 RepID=UPI0021E8384F|nr:DUF1788 domain-containing protein [Lentibacter sp. XHP0401]MCV2894506.1 DUF1788 domain-containing protein [Lentibacter sp. XHP0401]
MNQQLDRRARAEHLFKVVSGERFLAKEGLGNEVPFFICPFGAEDGLAMVEDRKDLIARLGHEGIRVLDVDLYDLSLEILAERDVLDQLIEVEPETDKSELKEMLQGVLDPQDHLIPKIGDRIAATAHEVIFLSGVGEVYPFLRSHNVLNNLQSTAKDKPTVLFFPGNYTHALATGASLDLFGLLHDDKYYRAFNIMNYEV